MAIFLEYTAEMQAQWDEWLASRPAVIQEMATRAKPNVLYRIKKTDQRVYMHSYNEDGTVTVNITGEFNPLYKALPVLERRVFGVAIDDLEECDLPEGWMLSQ